MEIFKLVGNIMVDSAEAQKSILQTGDKAEGLANKLGNGIKKAAKWAVAIETAAVAVGTAMIAMAKDTAANLDAIDKGSIRMGITTEKYQEYAYALEMCGVSMSVLEKAAKKLEGSNIPLDGALESILSIRDETIRTNAAIELFGESIAYDLGPLLQIGKHDFVALTREAHQLGLVLDDEAIKAGAELGDEFTKLSKAIGTIWDALIIEYMPYIKQVIDMIIAYLPRFQEKFRQMIDTIIPILDPLLQMLMTVLPELFDLAIGLLEKITPYVETAVEAISGLFSGLHGLLTGDMEEFKQGLATFFSDLVIMAGNAGMDIITALYNGMVEAFAPLSDWLASAFGSLGFYDNIDPKYITHSEGYLGSYYSSKYAQQFSHASGLAYVPYDGYNARLHRGETVLNSNDAAKLSSLLNSGGIGDGTPINITVQSVLDGRVIGETSYNYIKRKDKAVGA